MYNAITTNRNYELTSNVTYDTVYKVSVDGCMEVDEHATKELRAQIKAAKEGNKQ